MEKYDYAEQMLVHYPSFVHLSMGDLASNCAKLEERKPNSRFATAAGFIANGDFAPEDMVLELLIWNLNQYPTVNGFIIDGFPRTFQQYEDLKVHVCVPFCRSTIVIVNCCTKTSERIER